MKERKQMRIYRQGDVLLIETGDIPADAPEIKRQNGRVILALGEVTGHAHAIAEPDVDLRGVSEDVDRWLRVGQAGALLVHEEHTTIPIPAGNWIVRIQRQYSPAGIERVAD